MCIESACQIGRHVDVSNVNETGQFLPKLFQVETFNDRTVIWLEFSFEIRIVQRQIDSFGEPGDSKSINTVY